MLKIDNLVKTFDGETRRRRRSGRGRDSSEAADDGRVRAVDDVTFEVKQGELFTLLGPSGCGKTTTLRSIAGLERPDSGAITVDDRVLFSAGEEQKTVNVAANKRGLGMVFQSYAIWPHMTVFQNVAFPLQVMPRQERPSKSVISDRVMRVLEVMEVENLADRQATKLSGGQQQRLALARALVIEPSLLLLDEPLSNLDAKLRESLRFELKRLQRELGITSVYVTHDQIEALALSSHIAVMKEGKIVQMGKPRDIYENPQNKFVAEFIGTSNFIPGVVSSKDGGHYEVNTKSGPLRVASAADVAIGSDVVVSIRPESVGISVASVSDTSSGWCGQVTTRAFLGDSVDHLVSLGEQVIRARCNPSVSIQPGTEVLLDLEADKLALVPID
jgi:iron(III) transport system ATP-binding protein